MKKTYLTVAAFLFCINIAAADPINIMRPSSNPMMQTIQQNALQRQLPLQIEQDKEKEIRLEKIKQETLEQLRDSTPQPDFRPEQKSLRTVPTPVRLAQNVDTDFPFDSDASDNSEPKIIENTVNTINTSSLNANAPSLDAYSARIALRKQREEAFLRAEQERKTAKEKRIQDKLAKIEHKEAQRALKEEQKAQIKEQKQQERLAKAAQIQAAKEAKLEQKRLLIEMKKSQKEAKEQALKEVNNLVSTDIQEEIKTEKFDPKAEEKAKKAAEKLATREQAAAEKSAREAQFHNAIAQRTAERKAQRAEKRAQKAAAHQSIKDKRLQKKLEKQALKDAKKAKKLARKAEKEVYRENARRTDMYEKERQAQENLAKQQERQKYRALKKENIELAKQYKAEKKAAMEEQAKIDKEVAQQVASRNKQLEKEAKAEKSHIKDDKPFVLVRFKKDKKEKAQEEVKTESIEDTEIQDVEKDSETLSENTEKPKYNLKADKDNPDDNIVVYIKKVEFSPSEIFTDKELDELAGPVIGQQVTMTDIKNLVNSINRAYIINDYVTSRAYLPPQKIENGVLKINLFEGKVGEIIVRGNAWTRKSYISKRIGLDEGDAFKLRVLENSLIKFNNDHYDFSKNPFSIKAKLAPGKTPGTTDIIVDANDPLPFHITGVFDNAGRDSIGLLRGGLMLSTDSLTGNRDKLSLGSYLGRGTRIFFGDYNIPINKYGTRAGVSVSYNHIDVIKGNYKPFDISGDAFVYTAYLTHPLINRPDLAFNTYTAGNFKYSKTYFSDIPIYNSKTFSGTQGFTVRKDTKKGIWYTGHYATVGYMDTIPAHEMYWKYEGNVTRLHDFGHGIIGQFRAQAQISPNDMLPWIEQFQIGGISNVRGYSEGLLIGRSGYFLSAEIITPLPFLPKKVGTEKLGFVNLREIVKGALFFDQGTIFPYKGVGGGGVDSQDVLASFGPGLRIRINEYLNARVYWGFGLLQNKYETRQPTGRFHFEITSSPDVAALLKYKKFRETQPEKL